MLGWLRRMLFPKRLVIAPLDDELLEAAKVNHRRVISRADAIVKCAFEQADRAAFARRPR